MPETMTSSLLAFWNYLTRRSFLFIFTAALALVVLVLLFSAEGEAREIVVDEKGSGDYTRIDEAANNSSSGDVIIVKPGNYSAERLVVKDNITIMGKDRESSRLVLAQYQLFFFQEANITISGINFTSGREDIISYVAFPEDVANISVTNCTFYNLSYGIRFPYRPRDIRFENNSIQNSLLHLVQLDASRVHEISLANNSFNGMSVLFLAGQENRTVSQMEGGAILVDCTNITFKDLKTTRPGLGILIFHSSGIKVENCHISSETNALYSLASHDIHVSNSTLDGKEFSYFHYGVTFFGGSSAVLSNNTFSNGGLSFFSTRDNVVLNNTLMGRGPNNMNGIHLDTTFNTTITGNSMEAGGISFYGGVSLLLPREDPHFYRYFPTYSYCYTHKISGNTIAGKPIYAYLNQSDVVVPSGGGQVIAVNCNNMTIRGIDDTQVPFSIFLFNTTNSTIRDIHAREQGGVISLGYSDRNLVQNCTVFENENVFLGLSLHGSLENTITNNHFVNRDPTHGWHGVVMGDSSRNLIKGNIISGNVNGFYFSSISKNNIITENEITNNRVGIHLNRYTWNNTITNNNIYNNSKFGIELASDASNNLIATGNWWGNASGPYHATGNPNGTGDNITGNIEVSPWLTEESEWEKDEDGTGEGDSVSMGLYVLPILILVLLILILIVVRLPDERFSKTRIPPQEAEMIETPTSLPQRINSCPHCGGEFEVETLKRPIRFTCHFCGKKIKFK